MPGIIEIIGLRNLIVGVVVTGLLTGFGLWAYHHGRESRQSEIDALQKQISDYGQLGTKMTEVQTEIQNKINSGNKEIRDAILGNHESIDSQAQVARTAIANTIAALKSDAQKLKELHEKLKGLPDGQAKDDLQKIIDALVARQTGVECLSTPVPNDLVLKLKQTYVLGKI